ncbi:MAG: DUF305 domain-containing protein [bacterium]|nr:DUF305 domain-containing protein [bacterium]
MMNKNIILTLVVGLIIGVGGTLGVSALTNNDGNKQVTSIDQKTSTGHGSMTMSEMNEELEKLSGDEFDKAFIEMMTEHHEGAVEMAELIPSRAKHDEIKTLGQAIIAAQTKEISEMKQWQMDWGYTSSDSTMHSMNH